MSSLFFNKLIVQFSVFRLTLIGSHLHVVSLKLSYGQQFLCRLNEGYAAFYTASLFKLLSNVKLSPCFNDCIYCTIHLTNFLR